ncbi:MAG: hypothetical protein AB7F40_06940 [Victivallaceae bacterium]|nr:hypothetical protein [Victivallaceae bacterium]
MIKEREQGVALIAALILVFTASLLTAAVVALSGIHVPGSNSTVAVARSYYLEEGAANRVVWLLAADAYANTEEATLGDVDYSQYDTERYLPDGVVHTMDYYGVPVTFSISDAGSGMRIDDLSNEFTYLETAADDDGELADKLDTLLYRYTDYTDSDDDLADSDSYEKDEYEAMDDPSSPPLPRNSAVQYREELAWLPDFAGQFPPDADGRWSAFMLIPPTGMSMTVSDTPPLTSATKEQLMGRAGLEEDEAQEVLDAIASYRADPTRVMSDYMDALLLSELNSSFSRSDSGFYTVKMLHAGKEGAPSGRTAVSFEAVPSSGPDDDQMLYLEYFRY